ncbi:SDR family NAD(P)-dependent oxidoreductase [Hamadaea sp.]|uniref:SDR family NAD(P)-dependent oxidoreductase n=1 Tax=Hamadaea sp. TaxID=2024425 RepID=UPI0025C01612|nr:SDR family NAD(P)-dependent oxidoreductase [Hamadaea sp.]
MTFLDRYGPWALVAGASQGIGAAFARELSARGLGVVLVARHPALDLPGPKIEVAADLATVAGVETVLAATVGLEIGLLVANAALSPIGPFATSDPAELGRAIDLNVRAPMLLARHFLPAMQERGHGGFVVMSSLAGAQGSPNLSLYAGTKAFGAVFAEGLWAELRPSGVDVIACVAGAVSTPGLAASTAKPAPGTVTPQAVVAAALGALGRKPRVVPGGLMKASAAFLSRLPRRTAISIMGRASKDVLGS